jgi:hypothetical protein
MSIGMKRCDCTGEAPTPHSAPWGFDPEVEKRVIEEKCRERIQGKRRRQDHARQIRDDHEFRYGRKLTIEESVRAWRKAYYAGLRERWGEEAVP